MLYHRSLAYYIVSTTAGYHGNLEGHALDWDQIYGDVLLASKSRTPKRLTALWRKQSKQKPTCLRLRPWSGMSKLTVRVCSDRRLRANVQSGSQQHACKRVNGAAVLQRQTSVEVHDRPELEQPEPEES